MNNKDRDFKGVWIPKEMYLNTDLSWTEKIILIEIDSLDNDIQKGCFASNKYLGEFLGVKEASMANLISKLKKDGYITQIFFDGRNRGLRVNMKAGLIDKLKQTSRKNEGRVNNNMIQTSQKNEHSNTDNNTTNKTDNNILPFATVSEKKPKTNLQKVNDMYFELHIKEVGVKPNFSAVDAKKLKELYEYFLKINGNDENNALDSIRYIFVKFDTLTPFLRNVKPQAILSNISAIIMHFKEKNKKSEFIDFSQQAENYEKNKM